MVVDILGGLDTQVFCYSNEKANTLPYMIIIFVIGSRKDFINNIYYLEFLFIFFSYDLQFLSKFFNPENLESNLLYFIMASFSFWYKYVNTWFKQLTLKCLLLYVVHEICEAHQKVSRQ